MKALISNRFLAKLEPRERPFEVLDSQLPGFLARVQPTGLVTYFVQYGRGRREKLGRADTVDAADAREEAKNRLSRHQLGKDPSFHPAGKFKDWVEKEYRPWTLKHHKSASETLRRIGEFVRRFGNLKLPDINARRVERWRTERLAGVKAATVNRDLAVLRAALAKAVEWGHLETNPLARVRLSKTDGAAKVRYLDPDEEKRLRETLAARDERRRRGRENANAWRRERGYKTLPAFGRYTDHLAPLVLLAVNTGLRRGELFGLTWDDVDLRNRLLTVKGSGAKSGRTRHIPLNREAVEVLTAWRGKRAEGLVFGGTNGDRLDNIATSWRKLVKAAGIAPFRFHDCRHHFASRLVQAGASLYVVKELLGHATIQLTERYSHLAPESRRAAVELLDGGTQ